MSTKRKEKAVAGMTKAVCISRATNIAFQDGKNPDYVGLWVSHFDAMPCDHLREKGGEICNSCVDKDKCQDIKP
ncbi:hypothetical protein [Lelliottia nimipressuralis]|uniref:Uncharacterized protein n=1 Tax=Lelliottia nimipressuralis TaxID=69220 RepID=A0ABD4K5L6_9ENTR|nr:hypothetical protein [Lelliottia nimipressuralis]MBF4177256.1 hypothetical protein [Lelliottia nimipressuralis]